MPPRHNLPSEVASFIGRAGDLSEIQRLLTRTRLLTLTGAGGCGKTRLALRAAGEVMPNFPDGVWHVPLAPLADSALLLRAVSTALGVRGSAGRPLSATLVTALAARRVLLVLDNCEHLIGSCARLAETLLAACPHLRILATSREPLRIQGETTWRVPSLAFPGPGPLPSLESLAQVEAVALFLDRARALVPGFSLTPGNGPAVAAICRDLEGIPLGIELAAAQLGVLAPEQIASRLDDALRLLRGGSRTHPRQETLRATLDWSHALLSDTEQALFRRLSVFVGGFSMEAAETVCADEQADRADLLILLGALVEKSLVEVRVQGGEARYRLLFPVRQYAWTHLAACGESDGVQRRHAHYFLELAETAEPKLRSGRRGPWIERLVLEQDNLRTALSWSRRAVEIGDREVGLRMAGALFWFWNFRGEISEGLDWVEAALTKSGGASPPVRAKALYAAGELAWLLGRTTMARVRVEESAALFRALGDKRGLAYNIQSLPLVMDHPRASETAAESLRLFEEVGDAWGAALAVGALDVFALIRDRDPTGQGQARLQEALTRWRKLDDHWGMAQMLNMLGDLARSRDDAAGATKHYEEALTLLRGQGLTGSVPSLLHNLGYLALRGGDMRRALRLFRESLALFRDQGDQRGIADCLSGMAGVLGAMKQPTRAVQFLGAAEALREATGTDLWPANAADYDRTLALVRSQVDEAAWAAAWTAGRIIPLERVIADVLTEQPAGCLPGNTAGFDLTPREREVVVLVAQGLTNRQIGATLFITEGTARLHVKHILRSLGFTSRAQVAAWAVEQGLAAAPQAE